jgi:DNA (cytosine-5)-methyltransferase 1
MYEGGSNEVKMDDLFVFDLSNNRHRQYFNGELLPRPLNNEGEFVTTEEAISDLTSVQNGSYIKNKVDLYSKNLSKRLGTKLKWNGILDNHQLRKHSPIVKARFRAYQILNAIKAERSEAYKVFFGENVSDEIITKVYGVIKSKAFYFPGEGCLRKIRDIKEFKTYLRLLRTKKHSQRALVRNEPSPAQLTIPDDVCHYDRKELRTLSVREIARLQSFPDEFVFKGKITTGGSSRVFEVPQYTQVGNAVPPLLAFALGDSLRVALDNLSTGKKKKYSEKSWRTS